MPEYYVLVWANTGTAIPPYDCNSHNDQGMMIYSSHEAAQAMATRQTDDYSDEESGPAIAIPLSSLHTCAPADKS